MTIRELKELIKDLPNHMGVFIHQEHDEFPLSNVEVGRVTEASFSEDPGGKALAKEKVFLLTDEI